VAGGGVRWQTITRRLDSIEILPLTMAPTSDPKALLARMEGMLARPKRGEESKPYA
jgi:hypothetical protein